MKPYSKPKPQSSAFLAIHSPPSPKFRVICFPHAGGGASFFYSWRQHIWQNSELIAVQLPGRETRFQEALISDIKELVSHLFFKYPFNDWIPTVFIGNSLGALVAFELCRYMRRHQFPLPKRLVVCASKAPQRPLTRPRVGDLNNPELIDRVIEYGGLSEEVLNDKDLISLFTPIIRADFQLFENYEYYADEPLPIDILALGGVQDPMCNEEDILGWREQTVFRFDYHKIHGGHFFMKENVRQVLSTLNRYIAPLIVNEIVG